MSSIKKAWDFFKPIITKKDGSINVTQLKKELADFNHLMDQVPKVYCHVTGGSLSKVMYKSDVVIDAFESYVETREKEAVNIFIEDLQGVIGKNALEKVKRFAKEYNQ